VGKIAGRSGDVLRISACDFAHAVERQLGPRGQRRTAVPARCRALCDAHPTLLRCRVPE